MVKPRLDFLFFDAGGGHRAAATALEAVSQQQDRPWDVRLVDLNDILVRTDVTKQLTGYGLEDLYNLILAKGWTLGSGPALRIMQQAIRLFHRFQVNLIEEYWRGDPPAMAVSLVPNFNRAIYQALRRVTPTVPYVTVLTDIADYPPHFWIERDQDQYFICGSPKALRQASDAGHPANRIFGTSGMILRPAFYDVPAVDRAAERAKLGLDPDLPTALILFGGHGAPVIATIIERLQTVHRPLQVIAMCGHNEKLAAQLKRAGSKVPLHVQGFTREVPRFMQIADFMIGKPGPGSISEAVHMGLPVIVERNAWTLPQERYNADWLIENGVGIVLDNFTRIVSGVDNLLAEGHLDTYRAAARRMNNRAIFEVPDILERILCASRK